MPKIVMIRSCWNEHWFDEIYGLCDEWKLWKANERRWEWMSVIPKETIEDKIRKNSKPVDPEIQAVINKEFYNLI